MILVALKTITVPGQQPDGLTQYSPVLQRHEAGGMAKYLPRPDLVNPAGWHPANVSIAPGSTFNTVACGIGDAEANDLIANGYAKLAGGA